jgi:glycosyltransferase involved in cell wall biosynthesis
MKLSIVTAVLNSPEIVRRQILYYEKMPLSENVEWIVVDDGSDPPMDVTYCKLNNFSKHSTGDTREWTQPAARNFGVKQAKGEYVLCTDIDHIVPRETIDFLLTDHGYDVVRFRRECGILDESGNFTQDMDVMHEWGLLPERGLRLPPHGNSYCMRKGLFLGLGGSRQKDVYPNRDEVPLKSQLKRLEKRGEIKILQDQTKPFIYMFPNGRYCGDKDYNPFGLFHNLKR